MFDDAVVSIIAISSNDSPPQSISTSIMVSQAFVGHGFFVFEEVVHAGEKILPGYEAYPIVSQSMKEIY